MKYVGTFNLNLLHEELKTLVKPDASGVNVATYRMTVLSDGVTIDLDDERDRSLVNSVAGAHDHTKKSQVEIRLEEEAQRREAVLQKLELSEEDLEVLLGRKP